MWVAHYVYEIISSSIFRTSSRYVLALKSQQKAYPCVALPSMCEKLQEKLTGECEPKIVPTCVSNL